MKKTMDIIVKIETAIASLILVALIVVTFSGVFARYLFLKPFTWEEEFQLACMVWISFTAGPVAFHTHSHVAIEILVEVFPEKLQKIMEFVISAIVYFVLIYAAFRCVDFVKVILKTGRCTPILKIPYAIIYGVSPIAFVFMLVSFTYTTIVDYKEKWLAKKEVEAE